MSVTLKRYNSIRVADLLDDQKSPAEILNAYANSTTQEDLQEYILSQIRHIIHGDLGHKWYENFNNAGILSLKQISEYLNTMGIGGQFRENVSLVSADKNGDNRLFTTGGDIFVHDVNGKSIEIFHNGRKLQRSDRLVVPSQEVPIPSPPGSLPGQYVKSPEVGDYQVIEMDGPGTGFNAITLLTFSPIDRSNLTASYQLAL